jgi:biopolymer transport protein ExbB
MGFSHLIANTDITGLVVLAVMAVMSVLSWYYVFYNTFRILAVNRRARRVMEDFWNAASPQEATEQLRAQPEYEPFSKVALQASEAAAHYGEQSGGRMSEVLSRPEFIARRLEHSLKHEAGAFDTGLTLLATVGSTAPFVGLFGTVWGIYHALIGIGKAGKATLDVVAGPVGEALIMTCIGLGVAIPAVLMYNFFVRANKSISERLYTFGNDLLDYFATGSRVRTQRYGNRQPAQPTTTTTST